MKEKVKSIDVRGLKVETKHSEATESLQHQIILPFQTNQVPWFALDIGGSLIKIVYFESDREEHQLDLSFKNETNNKKQQRQDEKNETIAIYNLSSSDSTTPQKPYDLQRKGNPYEDSILEKNDIHEKANSEISTMKNQKVQRVNESVGVPQTPEKHQFMKGSTRIETNKHKLSTIASLNSTLENWTICARVFRKQLCETTRMGTIILNDGFKEIKMVIYPDQLQQCFTTIKCGREYFITQGRLKEKKSQKILYATKDTKMKRAYDYYVPFPSIKLTTLNDIHKRFLNQKGEQKHLNLIGVISKIEQTLNLENAMKTKNIYINDFSTENEKVRSRSITLWTKQVEEFEAKIGDVMLLMDIHISPYHDTSTHPNTRIFYNPDIPSTSALRSRYFKEINQTTTPTRRSRNNDLLSPPKSPIMIIKPNQLVDNFAQKSRVRSSSMSSLTATNKQPTKLGGRLCFINFRTRDIDDCLTFLQQFKNRSITRIHCTGGGSVKYKKRISEELGVEVQKMDEMYALIHGLNFLLKHIEDETYVFRGYNAKTREINRGFISYKHRWKDIYPYLLVNIGSGVSIIKVTGDNQYERVSGSSLGGGTFWGLCSMLTNYKSFNEMMESTLQGDNTKVDITVGDIYGSGYLNLHQDIIASSMAKPISLKTPRVPFEDADICKSALLMVCYNIAQIALLISQLHKLNRVYFAGYFIRDHPISMGAISKTLQFWSKGETRALFLKHEGYLGALGSFFQEFATPKSGDTPTSPSSNSPSTTTPKDKKSPLNQKEYKKPTPNSLFDEEEDHSKL